MLKFGSLFAGIGGMDLGLERAGMKCVWQVEADFYARQVLEKHWPSVPRYGDVRYFLGGKRWRQSREAWQADLICGGFPCQDISNAGKRAGIGGSRSGLWSEFLRVIRLLRPHYILVENVAALLGRGMGRVLGELSAIGFDARWSTLSACSLGAPHTRERVFIVAYATGHRWPAWGRQEKYEAKPEASLDSKRRDWRASESSIQRVAYGVPHRVDRLRGLGNAVVPQIAEWLGKRILEFDARIRSNA